MQTPAIAKICRKLFATTGITYFCYLRRYKNGFFTFLPTAIDLGSYIFEDGVYPHTWFAGLHFDELKSGYSFWEIAKQFSVTDTQNISCQVATNFKLLAGIEVIDKQNDYCDFYSFSSENVNIYFVSIHYLYQFVYYFKQECRSLLLNAHEDRLQLPASTVYLPPVPILNVSGEDAAQKNDSFDTQRFYLNEETFLTKREVEILKKMDKGETVKCVADELCISPRTLEHHITNIKSKLNVSRTAEILYLAKLNKLIP